MSVEDDLRTLEILDELANSATAETRKLRAEADGIYDRVVERIQKSEGCSASVAHAKAAEDPLARRAYELGLELEQREVQIRSVVGR